MSQGTVRHLERALGYPMTYLEGIATDLGEHYREKIIARGGKQRTIYVPSKILKRIQRRIIRQILPATEVHSAAFCHTGRSALQAARLHAKHPYLLKLDLENFFPSVSASRVHRRLADLFDRRIATLIGNLVTYHDHLPQGAASSVAVANVVLKNLDARLSGLCRPAGLTYTRYVDDLAISGGRRVGDFERRVRKIIAEEDWRVNEAKGGVFQQDERRTYLGLILNAEANLDPDYVRELYYLLKRLEQKKTPLSEKDRRKLKGRIQYVRSITPRKGERLLSEFSQYLKDASEVKDASTHSGRS
jgi:RNA-directed DNA polymerase